MLTMMKFALLLWVAICGASFTNDFTAYPKGAQQCLYRAADDSGCIADTGAEMNYCLCRNNGNFIYATAKCVAQQSPSDLRTVYAVIANNCAGTGTTVAVSEDAFLAQAAAATSKDSDQDSSVTITVDTATSTATNSDASTATDTTAGTTTDTTASTTASTAEASTETATSGNKDDNKDSSGDGLSTTVKLILGACLGLGLASFLVAIAFFYLYRKRRAEAKRYKLASQFRDGYSDSFVAKENGSRTSILPIIQTAPAELGTMREPVELPAALPEPVELPAAPLRPESRSGDGFEETSALTYPPRVSLQDPPHPRFLPSPVSECSSLHSPSGTNISLLSRMDETKRPSS